MRPTRFERATCGFEVRCSIQLSYRRKKGEALQAPQRVGSGI